MTNQEMIVILKGDKEGRVALFNSFMSRLLGGGKLYQNEAIVYQALKHQLIGQEANAWPDPAVVIEEEIPIEPDPIPPPEGE